MKIGVYNIEGEQTGESIDVSNSVFDAPYSSHTVYLAVKAQRANMRQGTSSTKNRAAVRGGGAKPWRQKGRGVARAGTIRSPLWVGGGRIFGPQPRKYNQKVNKKAKRVAKRSILSARLKDDKLTILDDFEIDHGKTNELVRILQNFDCQKQKVLILTSEIDQKLVQAGRNIPGVTVMRADMISTYGLINTNRIFMQKSAVSRLEEVLS